MLRLHRHIRRRARQRKRARDMALLGRAEAAAAKGGSRSLFQCVKLLSRSRATGKLRLRDDQEGLLPADKECGVLTDYAKGLFTGPEFSPPELQPLPEEWLDAEQWQKALNKLKKGKSVPHGQPPIASWIHDSRVFSAKLSVISQRALCGPCPFVPLGWCSVQLAWLPKPPQPPTQPKNLRSVGLTSGDSKAFLLLLKERLSERVYMALWDTPQFAYRKGVDTSNATLRAAQHCRSVRSLLQDNRLDLVSRVAGAGQRRLAGGMMASIDLAKAFDSVPRSEIQSSLEDIGLDSRLIAVLVRIHTQTQCLARQAGKEASTSMSRGLRQGCPLAPALYAAWAARLCRLLDEQLGVAWCSEHASIFADDTLGFWEIRSVGDMRRAVKELSCLIHTLKDLGLEVNLDKSSVLLSLSGVDKQKMLSAFSCVWRGKHQFRIPCEGGHVYIPLEDNVVYLGVILSYAGFEFATLKHRLTKAHQRFGRLRKVLRTNSSFRPVGRRRVYVARVWSSMRYGLSAVGITQSMYNELVSTRKPSPQSTPSARAWGF